MPEVKCPSCGGSTSVPDGAAEATCPFCGGTVQLASATASAPAATPESAEASDSREERMNALLKKYEEAMTRGDRAEAARLMEEYLRVTVSGMPGFEDPAKVDAFVSENMKTFREALGPAPAPGEPDGSTARGWEEDGGDVLRKA